MYYSIVGKALQDVTIPFLSPAPRFQSSPKAHTAEPNM